MLYSVELQRHGALGQIRTDTWLILSQLPLPVGLRGQVSFLVRYLPIRHRRSVETLILYNNQHAFTDQTLVYVNARIKIDPVVSWFHRHIAVYRYSLIFSYNTRSQSKQRFFVVHDILPFRRMVLVPRIQLDPSVLQTDVRSSYTKQAL
jgi:hypothetical protein